MFNKILVAIDDSEASSNLFEQALEFALTNKSEMMLIHVLPWLDDVYPGNPYVGMPEMAWSAYQKKWSDRENTEIKKLQLLEQEARKVGVSTQFTLNYGDPGKVICALAKSYDADLIIVGRRGINGLNELMMGSTSNYILHHAFCDILTIQDKALSLPKCEVKMVPAEVT